MGAIIGLVGLVAGLACFILSILIAIKMFQRSMIWQGILTILCFLFGAIYASSRKAELGIEKIYTPYLITGVVYIVCNLAARVMGGDAAV